MSFPSLEAAEDHEDELSVADHLETVEAGEGEL
jgi:hypothetical protein